ncbi:DMT family transporter [Merismopedia glauca]|uniref:DMT family transporter n=1 Tax=Merismopedia glauca TaxID=292586 RepID=UPI001FE52AFB|nr:DMT family transporter [Merismopedia glauca]
MAISIFGASSAVTRKLTEIGAQHFIGTHNPISLCNVLFVGNLCALFVLVIIYRRQLNLFNLKRLSRMEWFSLISVAIMAGAIAPGLIFQALALTGVNNVVLVGRLEPPLVLALSVWLLRERVNLWEIIGAIVAFIGVMLTIFLEPTELTTIPIRMSEIGIGELLAATGAIILAISTIIAKKSLSNVPLGIYNVVRTALGTAIFFLTALVLYGSDHFTDVLSPFLWQWMLAYGVLIVVIGQSFWLKGLRYLPVSTVSLVSSFTPIAGIFSAYLILGEVPTQAQYIGGSAILIGIFLSQVGIQHQVAYSRNRLTCVQTDQGIKNKTGFRGI